MKKKVLFGVVLVLTLSLTAPAWDVLGHAFIMEQIKGGPQNATGNELYGITSPDFVNYLLNTPYYDYLYKTTHTEFMRVWNMATTPAAQELAMGFVCHNGVWGADYIGPLLVPHRRSDQGLHHRQGGDVGADLRPDGRLGRPGPGRRHVPAASPRALPQHHRVRRRHPDLDGRSHDRRRG